MALVKYEPFRGLDSLAKTMNSFFDMDNTWLDTNDRFMPAIDVSEDDEQLTIYAEMPGVSKEDVKVTISGDRTLVIKGAKNREDHQEDKERSYIRIERSYGEFQREFALPENIKDDSIQAKYENGVLKVTFEKKEEVKPREIPVNIN